MRPEDWLKNSTLLKLRSKLPTWNREDILALAKAQFGGHDLDNKQLSSLIALLKDPNLPKPLASFYGDGPAEAIEVAELRWVANGEWEPASETAWYRTDRHLKLRFASARDAATWAFRLFEWDPRATWSKLVAAYKQRTRLASFNPPDVLPEYPLTPAASVGLAARRRQDNALTKALPDSGDIKKRYYGLEEGERLPHKEGDRALVVASVRVNLDAPPTITFREEVIP